ncbi:hypothetical protein BC936DRAFT_145513 [Jimgerdemannia flammicorona]|uniref:Uncharacterized protein n=2 Tax=Jimgerdemannia flammicorona TaxID=994334 RepID=A0A433QZZ2_9FUNG|nr:hypothetical protein BC936DRAFT_145513 [Jimgerdemannia flammicorona]RUS35348.1 hypothetical protein BC938DRAFT_471708 [Jimgerdemannia flammicorona]
MQEPTDSVVQPNTVPFAVQLDNELRQVFHALCSVEEFVSLEDAVSSEGRELDRDKHLTLILKDKQRIVHNSLTGLVNSVQALSICIDKGMLEGIHDVMKIADQNLRQLTAMMIAVQSLLRKESDRVNARQKQHLGFFIASMLGTGASWVKLPLFNIHPVASLKPVITMATPQQSLPTHSLTNTQHNDGMVTMEAGSKSVSGINGLLWGLFSNHWTFGFVVTFATLCAYRSFFQYRSIYRRAELLRHHEQAVARAVKELRKSCSYDEQITPDDDKGKLEAFVIRNLYPEYLFGAEGRLIVMKDCIDIEITIAKIQNWIFK